VRPCNTKTNLSGNVPGEKGTGEGVVPRGFVASCAWHGAISIQHIWVLIPVHACETPPAVIEAGSVRESAAMPRCCREKDILQPRSGANMIAAT